MRSCMRAKEGLRLLAGNRLVLGRDTVAIGAHTGSSAVRYPGCSCQPVNFYRT